MFDDASCFHVFPFLFFAVNMFEHLFLEINHENKQCLVLS